MGGAYVVGGIGGVRITFWGLLSQTSTVFLVRRSCQSNESGDYKMEKLFGTWGLGGTSKIGSWQFQCLIDLLQKQSSVQSYYRELLTGEEVAFSYSSIWVSKVLRKVTYVSWCFMHKGSGEDVDHLLVHFLVAFRLWWEIMNGLVYFGWCQALCKRYCLVGMAVEEGEYVGRGVLLH